MKKQIEQAIANINIVLRAARMTADEHNQLNQDLLLIIEELKRIEEWTEEGKKKED